MLEVQRQQSSCGVCPDSPAGMESGTDQGSLSHEWRSACMRRQAWARSRDAYSLQEGDVHEWLSECRTPQGSSLDDHSGSPSRGLLKTVCSFEDDLSLGAEANHLLPSKAQPEPHPSEVLQHKRSLYNQRGNSMNSTGSGKSSTVSSVSELLDLCEQDPEDVLYNLGFGQEEPDLADKVPSRFFCLPSGARGIDIKVYLGAQLQRMELENPNYALTSRFRQIEVLTTVANEFIQLYSQVSGQPLQRIGSPGGGAEGEACGAGEGPAPMRRSHSALHAAKLLKKNLSRALLATPPSAPCSTNQEHQGEPKHRVQGPLSLETVAEETNGCRPSPDDSQSQPAANVEMSPWSAGLEGANQGQEQTAPPPLTLPLLAALRSCNTDSFEMEEVQSTEDEAQPPSRSRLPDFQSSSQQSDSSGFDEDTPTDATSFLQVQESSDSCDSETTVTSQVSHDLATPLPRNQPAFDRLAGQDEADGPVAEPITAQDSTTPVAEPITAQDSTTPVARPTTAQDNTTPMAEPITAQDSTTPVARPTTAQDNTTPMAEPITAQDTTTPVARPTTAQDNTTPMAEPITAQDNTTPVAEPITAQDSTTPVTRSITAQDNTTPVAEPITAQDNTTSVAERITAQDNSTSVARPITAQDNTTPVAWPITAQDATSPVLAALGRAHLMSRARVGQGAESGEGEGQGKESMEGEESGERQGGIQRASSLPSMVSCVRIELGGRVGRGKYSFRYQEARQQDAANHLSTLTISPSPSQRPLPRSPLHSSCLLQSPSPPADWREQPLGGPAPSWTQSVPNLCTNQQPPPRHGPAPLHPCCSVPNIPAPCGSHGNLHPGNHGYGPALHPGYHGYGPGIGSSPFLYPSYHGYGTGSGTLHPSHHGYSPGPGALHPSYHGYGTGSGTLHPSHHGYGPGPWALHPSYHGYGPGPGALHPSHHGYGPESGALHPSYHGYGPGPGALHPSYHAYGPGPGADSPSSLEMQLRRVLHDIRGTLQRLTSTDALSERPGQSVNQSLLDEFSQRRRSLAAFHSHMINLELSIIRQQALVYTHLSPSERLQADQLHSLRAAVREELQDLETLLDQHTHQLTGRSVGLSVPSALRAMEPLSHLLREQLHLQSECDYDPAPSPDPTPSTRASSRSSSPIRSGVYRASINITPAPPPRPPAAEEESDGRGRGGQEGGGAAANSLQELLTEIRSSMTQEIRKQIYDELLATVSLQR